MKSPAITLLALVWAIAAQAQQSSTVLVDIFTNSHCSPCAAMHGAVSTNITNSTRNGNVIVVYNHLSTYQDDPIYQANTTQPRERAIWLGGVSGTPTTFFNGTRQSGSYANWPASLDALLAVSSDFSITSTLTYTADSLVLLYTIRRTSQDVSPSVYGVLVENVTFKGRNGVSDHDGAMRALFTPVQGLPLDFDSENKASGRISIARKQLWDVAKLRAVVSVQDPTSKKSLQAVQSSAQMATSIDEILPEPVGPAVVEVYSVTGAVLSRKEGIEQNNDEIVAQSTRSLASGAYFVRIVRGSTIAVRPITITR